MKKLILFIMLLSTNVFASQELFKDISIHDECCHYCRISKNRERVKIIEYSDCINCKKTYCENCLEKNPDGLMNADGCAYCQEKCCCSYKKCEEDHAHCYTYRRTLKRHASSGKEVKVYNKKKKENRENEENFSCVLDINEGQALPTIELAPAIHIRTSAFVPYFSSLNYPHNYVAIQYSEYLTPPNLPAVIEIVGFERNSGNDLLILLDAAEALDPEIFASLGSSAS